MSFSAVYPHIVPLNISFDLVHNIKISGVPCSEFHHVTATKRSLQQTHPMLHTGISFHTSIVCMAAFGREAASGDTNLGRFRT